MKNVSVFGAIVVTRIGGDSGSHVRGRGPIPVRRDCRERWHILLAIKSSQPSSVCHFRATSLRLRAFHAHGSSRLVACWTLGSAHSAVQSTVLYVLWSVECGPGRGLLLIASAPAPGPVSLIPRLRPRARSAPLSSRGEETRIRRPENGSRGSARRNDRIVIRLKTC